MTHTSTEQERAEFEDGAWYWVEFPSFRSGKHVAPAMYKANCDSWYSYEYSGHSTRFVKVLEPCLMQAARRAPVVPQFSHVAKTKLNYLLEAGEAITGYAIENKDGRRGAIDCHGFVYWWQVAAAPQPPACNPSMQPTADHFPAVGQMVAAPVQLPEYGIDTANHAGVRVRGYTEQQVRQLLAAQKQSHRQQTQTNQARLPRPIP